MRKYCLIGAFGFIGAILRYLIKSQGIFDYSGSFPLNTFIINISGSYLLAFFLIFALEVISIDPDLRIGIATGLLGAYTTFSTFCKETSVLILSGQYPAGLAYSAISIMMGLFAAYAGMATARMINYRLRSRGEK
ncbi:MAG: CrcB family protein [Eubacteriaceae bacterium]|nr:CrcB family protein [Eubacteriaceae bacterium]